MIVVAAARVVTTPASPLWTIVATLATVAAVWVAWIGYRLARKQGLQTLEQKRQDQMTEVVTTLNGVHAAVFGTKEGESVIPGIRQIALENGEKISETADAAADAVKDAALVAAQANAGALGALDEHIQDDLKVHKAQTRQLTRIEKAVVPKAKTPAKKPVAKHSQDRRGR